MQAIYDQWPDYFREASNMDFKLSHEKSFYDSIIFCGMGGSGTSCDILNDVMCSEGSIPSVVLRGQKIPSFVNSHSIVVVSSASGNTRESISMMREASTRGAEVICISSGGMIEQLSQNCTAKHVRIPNILSPRASLPFLLMPALKIIEPLISKRIQTEVIDIPNLLQSVLKTIGN